MLLSLLKSRLVSRLACLLLLIAFPFFFVKDPGPHSTPLVSALWDCGHLLFFAGLVIALQTRVDFSKPRAAVMFLTGVFIGGGLIEIIQAHTGRDGNWQDLLRDLTGAWVGLFWLQKANARVWLGRVMAIIFLLPTIFTVYTATYTQYEAEKIFPQLANFETDVDLHGIKGNIQRSNTLHSLDQYSLKVHLNTEPYAQVSFNEFFNSWQGYGNLLMDIYNPDSQVLDLVIRIDDVEHELGDNAHNDRFNKALHLEPGWNKIKIPISEIQHAPATRLLNLDEIKSMVIFARQLPQDRDIYLDNIRLQ